MHSVDWSALSGSSSCALCVRKKIICWKPQIYWETFHGYFLIFWDAVLLNWINFGGNWTGDLESSQLLSSLLILVCPYQWFQLIGFVVYYVFMKLHNTMVHLSVALLHMWWITLWCTAEIHLVHFIMLFVFESPPQLVSIKWRCLPITHMDLIEKDIRMCMNCTFGSYSVFPLWWHLLSRLCGIFQTFLLTQFRGVQKIKNMSDIHATVAKSNY